MFCQQGLKSHGVCVCLFIVVARACGRAAAAVVAAAHFSMFACSTGRLWREVKTGSKQGGES